VLRPHRAVTKTIANDNGVENTNGVVRQYLHKGSDFDKLAPWVVPALEETLNFRPRETLGCRTPREVFSRERVNS
jgi:IS30 family transposase